MNRYELDEHTKDELQEMARERDLPVSGTKDEIIDRLLDEDGSSGGSAGSSGNGGSTFADMVERLRTGFESVLGTPVEQIAALTRDGDTWNAEVQVVDQRRVPPSADLVSLYKVTLDLGGEITGMERTAHGARARIGS